MKFLLTIDGGGARALIALKFLHNFEIYLLEKHNKHIYDLFDMYAGTSSGSMLIVPIVYKKYSIDYILKNMFTFDNITKLFTKNWSLFGLSFGLKPKFCSQFKTDLINEYSEKLQIHETDKLCMITGYNITTSEPMFFKSYTKLLFDKGLYTSSDIYDDVDVATAVNISTSAPSYYASVQFKVKENTYYGCDGGIFAMNPSDCLYVDALKIYGTDDTIKILSIGLGSHIFKPDVENSVNWGPIQWLYKGSIIDRLTTCNIPTVNYKMECLTKLFNDKYIRIEPFYSEKLNNHSFEINDIEDYNFLLSLGDSMWNLNKNTIIKEFIDL